MKLHLLNKTMLKVKTEVKYEKKKSKSAMARLLENGDSSKEAKIDSVNKYKLYFRDIPWITCLKCLQICKLKKCFSKQTRQKSEIFSEGNKRVNKHLEIKNIIKISSMMKIFRRIFWEKGMEQVIVKLQMDGLLQDDVNFFDQ
jgi:hypothetical protein